MSTVPESKPTVPRGRSTAPIVLTTIEGIRRQVSALRAAGCSVALVPTMGALHAGHLSLVDIASANADAVIVSVFVNPAQFGPTEDLAKYPRTLDADVEALTGVGVDAVFAPAAEELYPAGWPTTLVTPGAIATRYEGALRPGHFAGVLTVVTKLLNIVQPDVAVFGEKDAQQLALVRRLVKDLDIPTTIVAAPTRRDTEGLALSSRNRYLSDVDRATAQFVPRAVTAVVEQARAGAGAVQARDAGIALLRAQPSIALDYLDIVDEEFAPVRADHTGSARVIVAARVGQTRLIDNASIVLTAKDPA